MNEFERVILENIVVLYIEDENVTRNIISNELKKSIPCFYTAKDGFDGIAKYYKYKPHIIITDLIMPNKTGLEFARELRNNGIQCPIIITSIKKDFESILELVELGIEQYLVKPINTSELLEHILRIIKKNIFFETEKYINNKGILLDQERQKQIESLFRVLCTTYLKSLLGKGPRKVEVSILGNSIEIKAIDSLTFFEQTLIDHGYDNCMIDFNRTFLYKSIKDDIEEKFSTFCNMKMKLENIEVNSKKHFDKFKFSF